MPKKEKRRRGALHRRRLFGKKRTIPKFFLLHQAVFVNVQVVIDM